MKELLRPAFGRILDWQYGNAPRTVNIESTSHCNAKCLTCPHPYHERLQGIMDDDLYIKVLDESIALGVKKIHLQNFGEPLIDRKLPEKIKMAKDRGIDTVKIISNASALTEKKSHQLIEAGLDEIKISFDGLSKEVFEKVRVGLKYEKIAGNLEGLIRIRGEMGRSNPKVQLMFVSIKENEFEETGFVDRWKGVVDRVDVTRAHNWGGSDHVAGESDPKNKSGFQCMRLWQTFTVLWDGRVSICCVDYEGSEIVGDMRTDTMHDIWHGARLAQIRDWHTRGEFGKVPVCGNCTAR
jgi:MoaA/NifB/PqqE/SkfB family radical SAM enzyme